MLCQIVINFNNICTVLSKKCMQLASNVIRVLLFADNIYTLYTHI